MTPPSGSSTAAPTTPPRRRWRWRASTFAVGGVLVGLLVTHNMVLAWAVDRWAHANLNGTLSTQSMSLTFGGVRFEALDVKDPAGREVLHADAMDLDWSPSALWHGNLLGLGCHLRFDHPRVHVVRRDDGQWNLATLLRTTTTNGPPIWGPGQFGALADIQDGSVTFTDDTHGHFEQTLAHIDVTVDGHDGPLTVHAEARQESGLRLVADGQLDEDRRHYSTRAIFSQVALEPWANYALAKAPVVVSAGQAEVKISLWGDLDPQQAVQPVPDVVVEGSVENGACQVVMMPGPITALSGAFSATQNGLRLNHISGQVGPARVTVAGNVDGFAHPVLHLVAQVPALDLDAAFRYLHRPRPIGLAGNLSAVLHVDGALDRLRLGWDLSARSLAWHGLSWSRVSVQGALSDGAVHVTSLSADQGQGHLSGHGWVFPSHRQTRLWLSVKAQNVPLRPYGHLLGTDLAAARGDLDIDMLGVPPRLTVWGQAALRDGQVRGVPVQLARTTFTYGADALFTRDGQVDSGLGRITVRNGFFDTRSKDWLVSLQGRGVTFPSVPAGIFGHMDAALDLNVSLLGHGAHLPDVWGSVTGGTLQYGHLHFTDVQAPVLMGPGMAQSLGGTARYENTPIYFTGQTLLPPEFTLDLSLYAPNAPLGLVQRDLPWTFPFQAAGHGPLWLDLVGGPDVGVMWSFLTDPETGTALTEGYTAPNDFGFTGWALGTNLDVHRMSPAFAYNFDPRGRADVAVLLDGIPGQVASRYSFRGHGLTIDGLPVDWGAGEVVALPHDHLDVRDNYFLGPTANLEVHGDRQGDLMHLKLNAWDVDLAGLHRTLDLARWKVPVHDMDPYLDLAHMSGSGGVQGSLDGPVGNPWFTGHLNIPRGWIGNLPFSMDGDLLLTREFMQTSRMDWLRNQSEVTGSGRVYWGKPVGFEMDLDSSGVRAEDILPGWKIPLSATGMIRGNVHLSGTTEHPLLNGKVSVDHPTLYGQPMERLDATFASASHRLNLQAMHAVFAHGEAHAHGTLDQKDSITLAFDANHVALGGLPALSTWFGKDALTGDVSGQGQLAGTFKTLHGHLDLVGDDVHLQGHAFDHVTLKTTFSPHAIELSPLAVQGPSGGLSLTGRVELPDGYVPSAARKAVLGLQLQSTDLDASLLSPFVPGHWTLGGTISGTGQAQGPVANPHLSFDLVAKDAALGPAVLGQVTAKGDYTRQQLKLDSVTFNGGELHGTWQPHKSLDGEAHVKDFDLAFLGEALPHPVPMSGRLDLDVQVGGETTRSAFKIRHGAISKFAYDDFSGQVVLDAGVLHLQDIRATSPHQSLILNGSVPLAWKGGEVVSSGPIDLSADLDEGDLNLLSLMLPQLDRTAGTLKATLRATGPMTSPQLAGRVQINDGLLKFNFMNNPVSDLQVSAVFAQRQLQIKEAHGRVGDGVVFGSGFADLDRLFAPQLAFGLKGSGLAMSIPHLYEGRADLNVKLEGSLGEPRLTGSFTAREGSVYVPEDMLAETPAATTAFPLAPVKLGLTLTLADDVWLKFFGSSIRTRGDLYMTGTAPDPHISGEVNTVGGTVNLPLLGLFKIDSGKAHFDGSSFLPYVDVTAEQTVGNYQVFMRWEGDLKNPPAQPVTLSSSPPLPTADIFKLLTGQQPVAGGPAFSGGPTNPVNNVFANVGNVTVVQPLLQAVGKVFALSDVSLETVQPNLYAVKLAKAMDTKERLFFTVTRIFAAQGQVQQLYGIEIHPRIGFLLRVATGDLGAYSFLFQYNHRY